MLKILSTKQIKELDTYTIEHEPIPSIDLMERACRSFVIWFTKKFDNSNKIGIVCGTGNNGGDGLGVARLLQEWGYSINVWIVRGSVPESSDFTSNLNRLSGKVGIFEIASPDENLFLGQNILIDAIFGSGLSRPVEGIYARTIESINQSKAIRIAIDIPSGLMADTHSTGVIVKAHHTLSFQLPKLAFFMPENYEYVGEWALANIGLKKDFIREATSQYFQIQLKDVKKIKRPRLKFHHKGNYGRAMLISGSYGKMGAAVLAARAAMRSGLGLLTVHTPKCGYDILQTSIPEAMVSVDVHDDFFSTLPEVEAVDTIGIGPGIGIKEETAEAFGQLLDRYKKPIVIDADCLNLISTHTHLLLSLPPDCILTPHPKEFERLVGSWSNDFERLEKLKTLAKDLKAVIVLKGANSSIASPEGDVYFNFTGNPGMATGGSGDVLTGILTGILAQGYPALETAILGTYLHGLSGDCAAIDKGMDSLIASDLVDYLPNAFKRIDQ